MVIKNGLCAPIACKGPERSRYKNVTSIESAAFMASICLTEYPIATAALSIFGYVLIDCTWTSVYLMTAEIFPTVLRLVSTCLSTVRAVAILGGLSSTL